MPITIVRKTYWTYPYYGRERLAFSGGTPTLREAIYAALLADPGVAAVVGARIFPDYPPESADPSKTLIVFTIKNLPSILDLDGQGGLGMAMVTIECRDRIKANADNGIEAVRTCLGAVAGSLAGLAVTAVLPVDETDTFGDPADATDIRPRSISQTWRIHYRESRP